jgi:hypothetical protein
MVAKKQGTYQLEERVGFAMYVALNYIHQYPAVASCSQFTAFGRSKKSNVEVEEDVSLTPTARQLLLWLSWLG